MTLSPSSQVRLLALICVVGFCISIFVNYSGFMSSDSFVQILEARDGAYTNGHPPFMAFLWHFIDRIIRGPLGMLLLQTLLLWLGAFLVARYWFAADGSLFLAIPASLIVLYPPIFTISGVIWKDIFMLGFLMLAIGVAGALRSWCNGSSLRFVTGLAILALLLFLAMLFRYNAIVAAVPLMALGVISGLPEGKKFRFVIAAVVSTAVCAVLLTAVSFVNRKLTVYSVNPWAFTAVFDIAGTIAHSPDANTRQELYQRIPPSIRGDGTPDRLLETYNPRDWLLPFRPPSPALFFPPLINDLPALQRLYTGFQLNSDDTKTLVNLWKDCVVHHPNAWLHHRASVFRSIIGFNNEDLWSPVFMNPNGGQERVTRFYGKNPPLNNIQLALKQHFELMSRHLFYRPWLYLLLAFLVAVVCLFFWNPATTDIFLIAFSGLAYEGILFLVGPSADFRYSQYLIYIAVLTTLLLVRRLPPYTNVGQLRSKK